MLWSLADSGKLSSRAVDVLDNLDNDIYFSTISLWEVAIKRSIKNDFIPFDEEFVSSRAIESGFKKLDLKSEHIFALKSLKRIENSPQHKDPFDRLLISQAKCENMLFLTHDETLKYYDESFITLV